MGIDSINYIQEILNPSTFYHTTNARHLSIPSPYLLNTRALRTPRALTAAIRCSPVIAAASAGVALERVRCHTLRLDCICAGADDAVATVDSRLEPGHTRAPVGAAGTCLEVGRIYGGNGGEKEENGGLELHCGERLGMGC